VILRQTCPETGIIFLAIRADDELWCILLEPKVLGQNLRFKLAAGHGFRAKNKTSQKGGRRAGAMVKV
jgi:hypothetical protein